MADKYCPNCGKLILPTDEFCANCGQKLAAGKPVGLRIFSLIVLILIGLPAALVGSCGLAFSFSGGWTGLAYTAPFALLGFGVFAGILVWFLSIWRRS